MMKKNYFRFKNIITNYKLFIKSKYDKSMEKFKNKKSQSIFVRMTPME